MNSVPRPSPPRSEAQFLQPVSGDVTSQWMNSVPRPSPPRSEARFLKPVSGDVTRQWKKSVPRPSPPRSAARFLQSVSCDVMNQPVMSVTQHNPLGSLHTVPFDVLPHHSVISEMQEIKTSQAARFYSDYDDDSLQEQPHATVRVEDPCSNMMRAHESAKQMYPHGGSIVNAAKGTSSFPDSTDPNFHPPHSFPSIPMPLPPSSHPFPLFSRILRCLKH